MRHHGERMGGQSLRKQMDGSCPHCCGWYWTRLRAMDHVQRRSAVCSRAFGEIRGVFDRLLPEVVRYPDEHDAGFRGRCRREGKGWLAADPPSLKAKPVVPVHPASKPCGSEDTPRHQSVYLSHDQQQRTNQQHQPHQHRQHHHHQHANHKHHQQQQRPQPPRTHHHTPASSGAILTQQGRCLSLGHGVHRGLP